MKRIDPDNVIEISEEFFSEFRWNKGRKTILKIENDDQQRHSSSCKPTGRSH